MNAFEYNGEWWLADNPSQRVAGIVKFDPSSGCTLEIVGHLHGFGDLFSQQYTIFGVTTQNHLTLYNCQISTLSFGESNHQIFRAGAIFVGLHATPEELKFQRLRIQYAQFERWLNMSGIEPSVGVREGGQFEGTIAFKQIHIFEKPVNDFEIKIRTRLAYERKRDVKLSEQAVIEVRHETPLSLNEWGRKFITPFEDFLSLALNASVYPTEVKFFTDEFTEDRKARSAIEAYFRVHDGGESGEDAKNTIPLFHFTDIAETFDKHLQIWFEKRETLQDAIGLYLAACYHPPIYINLQFLILAQAIEAYHRKAHTAKYLEKAEYDERVLPVLISATKTIQDLSLNAEARNTFLQHLQKTFTFGYEFSLRKRIVALLTNYLSEYASIVEQIAADPKLFARVFADTRNYYSHYVKDEDSRAVTDVDGLWELFTRSKLIFQLCILMELGLSREKVELITRTEDFVRTANTRPGWH